MNKWIIEHFQLKIGEHFYFNIGDTSAYENRANTFVYFSYLNLLPEDGSYPHRTQPIGKK